MIRRRQVLRWFAGGLGGAAVSTMPFFGAKAGNRASKEQKVYPPIALHLDDAAVRMLSNGLRGMVVERSHRAIAGVWLQDDKGAVWSAMATGATPQRMFEIWSLTVEKLESLQTRMANWTPPQLPEGIPESIRKLLSATPAVPTQPSQFEPWPFDRWECGVARRVEFIVADVDVGPTFGNEPNIQSVTKPGSVPREASAVCEAVAGLLFTSNDGRRLLCAVDPKPGDLVWTQDAGEIDAYLASCEVEALTDHVRRTDRR